MPDWMRDYLKQMSYIDMIERDEFFYEAKKYPTQTQYSFLVEKQEENIRLLIERPEASLPDFLLSL